MQINFPVAGACGGGGGAIKTLSVQKNPFEGGMVHTQ